jgi:hypothetical protein
MNPVNSTTAPIAWSTAKVPPPTALQPRAQATLDSALPWGKQTIPGTHSPGAAMVRAAACRELVHSGGRVVQQTAGPLWPRCGSLRRIRGADAAGCVQGLRELDRPTGIAGDNDQLFGVQAPHGMRDR